MFTMNLRHFLISLIVCCCCCCWTMSEVVDQAPGETWPDFLEMEEGDSRNITCRMNPLSFPQHNATDLYFVDEEDRRVPDYKISILNKTSIVFMLGAARRQQNVYTCMCDGKAIMETKVYVGTKPQPVTSFKCRSYNFEYLICNFTQPQNTVLTQYNLTFNISNESPQYFYTMTCNYERRPLVVCNYTTTTTRHNINKINFSLDAHNALGENHQWFSYNPFDMVVPARPGGHYSIAEAEQGLEVNFTMPNYELYKMRSGLRWHISLQPQNMSARDLSNEVKVMSRNTRNDLHFRIKHLPYGNYSYTLRIRARVLHIPNDGDKDMWSEAFTYEFWSKPRLPRAPLTTEGAFYVYPIGKVRIYWEQLEPHEYNGNNFAYEIEEKNQKNLTMDIENNSATFNQTHYGSYEFLIFSRNHLGRSIEGSLLRIPNLHREKREDYSPTAIYNVYNAKNRTYTLTWRAPVKTERLRDYSVFWCKSKTALQECKDSIHFKKVNSDVFSFTTEPLFHEQEHNLAVSANYANFTTGMHWSPCAVEEDSDLVKMEPEEVNITSTSIRVQWSSGNLCTSVLIAFNLTYCKLTVNENVVGSPLTCEDEPRVITIGKDIRKFDITNLAPFTQYKVNMLMYSKRKEGRLSDDLIVRTLAAAPSPPRRLRLLKVTNTTAKISWLPPIHLNGRIDYYTIHYNEKQDRLQVQDEGEDPTEEIEYVLRNLTSFADYKVQITAHTVDDSDYSNSIGFTTRIGYPSMIGNYAVYDHNKTLRWSEPSYRAGLVDFYVVAVVQKYANENVTHFSTVIGATSCQLEAAACTGEIETAYKIRAVNLAELTEDDLEEDNIEIVSYAELMRDNNYGHDNKVKCIGGKPHRRELFATEGIDANKQYRVYKSPWLNGPQVFCNVYRASHRYIFWIVLIVPCLFGVVSMAALICKKYKKMANIKCTLPAGLNIQGSKSGFPELNLGGGASGHGHEIITEASDIAESPIKDSKDYLLHNESHHLLGSMMNNDSGYGHSANLVDAPSAAYVHGQSAISRGDSIMDDHHHGSYVDDKINDVEKMLQLQQIKEPQDAQFECIKNMLMTTPDGYYNPANGQDMNYINSGNLAGVELAGSNGEYFQPDTGGYFKPIGKSELLEKSMPNMEMNSGYVTVDTINKGISGYVTQRDLTAFGQMQSFN